MAAVLYLVDIETVMQLLLMHIRKQTRQIQIKYKYFERTRYQCRGGRCWGAAADKPNNGGNSIFQQFVENI